MTKKDSIEQIRECFGEEVLKYGHIKTGTAINHIKALFSEIDRLIALNEITCNENIWIKSALQIKTDAVINLQAVICDMEDKESMLIDNKRLLAENKKMREAIKPILEKALENNSNTLNIIPSQATFANAQVGDRVWSPFGQECLVGETNGRVATNGLAQEDPKRNLTVIFDNGRTNYFSMNGLNDWRDSAPSLFWSRPEIIAPEQLKKKVKMKIERWVVLSKEGFSWSFSSKEDAMNFKRRIGEAEHIIREYEKEV